jgi:hypothetical protein
MAMGMAMDMAMGTGIIRNSTLVSVLVGVTLVVSNGKEMARLLHEEQA